MTDGAPAATRPAWLTWAIRAIAAAGLVVVVWVCVTAWPVLVHGHPLYPVLLALTVAGCAVALVRNRRPRSARGRGRRAFAVVLAALAIGWVGTMAWLRPFPAVEPALAAMHSDAAVTVTETATRIELVPTAGATGTAVFFQPGAKVDARAYAAVLAPLAEAGYPVIIAKQPVGIAFLALGAFDDARDAHPEITQWVVGGHSLGGVAAVIEADAADGDQTAPAVGLLLYGSYPAGDVSTSLTAAVESISGSLDGLSTPEKIEASRADLPADASFTVIEGGVHAFFGDYGSQPGDGTPTITHDVARTQISDASLAFVDSLASG